MARNHDENSARFRKDLDTDLSVDTHEVGDRVDARARDVIPTSQQTPPLPVPTQLDLWMALLRVASEYFKGISNQR